MIEIMQHYSVKGTAAMLTSVKMGNDDYLQVLYSIRYSLRNEYEGTSERIAYWLKKRWPCFDESSQLSILNEITYEIAHSKGSHLDSWRNFVIWSSKEMDSDKLRDYCTKNPIFSGIVS